MKKVMIIVISFFVIVTLLESIAIVFLLKKEYKPVSAVEAEESASSSLEESLENYEKEVKLVDLIFEKYMKMNNMSEEELKKLLAYSDNKSVNITLPKLINYDNAEEFEKAYFDVLDEIKKIKGENYRDFGCYREVYHLYKAKYIEDDMNGAAYILISDYDDDKTEYLKAFFRIIGAQNGRIFDDEYFNDEYFDRYFENY